MLEPRALRPAPPHLPSRHVPRGALQDQADRSARVAALAQLQARAGGVAQREGDDVDDDSRPADKITLMASVKNGKIGSIYFPDGSRIRTTHSQGPARETHANVNTYQFTVDDPASATAFEAANPAYKDKQGVGDYWDTLDRWVAEQLKGKDVTGVPAWATPIESADDALPAGSSTSDAAKGKILFEVFTDAQGDVVSQHPSRGVAEKLETDTETVEVLNRALQAASGESDAAKRNEAFYAYVKQHAPAFAAKIRTPEEAGG